jgi:hypothetical protein
MSDIFAFSSSLNVSSWKDFLIADVLRDFGGDGMIDSWISSNCYFLDWNL